jgi:hypothetical protein
MSGARSVASRRGAHARDVRPRCRTVPRGRAPTWYGLVRLRHWGAGKARTALRIPRPRSRQTPWSRTRTCGARDPERPCISSSLRGRRPRWGWAGCPLAPAARDSSAAPSRKYTRARTGAPKPDSERAEAVHPARRLLVDLSARAEWLGHRRGHGPRERCGTACPCERQGLRVRKKGGYEHGGLHVRVVRKERGHAAKYATRPAERVVHDGPRKRRAQRVAVTSAALRSRRCRHGSTSSKLA